MIRLLLRLLNIKDYETCKSCETLRESRETLKQQLDLANNEKRELMNTLIQLTKPNVIVPSEEVKILEKAPQAAGTFSRRRSILENMERKKANITKTSPYIVQPYPSSIAETQPSSKTLNQPTQHITPQSVERLEAELGLVDEEGAEQNAS